MNSSQNKPILVLGGTGKSGRRVVERLLAAGRPVRVGSRAGTPPFDWKERGTWAPALDGVASAYMAYYPDIAIPGAVEATREFAELALSKGVTRLVLLSGRGEPEAERAERAVRDTGAELTVLRSTWFMQNFSEDFLADYVLSGQIRWPGGDGPIPYLDVEDIADIAVAALTDDRHIGELYELTGPRSLTHTEIAAEISEATGREIEYVPISVEQFAAEAAEQGLPAEVIELLTYLLGEVLDGRNAATTDGVRRALGREARDFADFARAVAASGAWDPAPVSA